MDPVALIFAALAAFIIFRLISALGTRTGNERRPDLEGVQRSARAAEARAETDVKAAPSSAKPLPPVSPAAEPLRAADPAFDEATFLDGAKIAYEMIVEAFAAGDLKNVRRYLSPSVYEAFRSGVAEREAAGRTLEVKFVGTERASIAKSEVSDETMAAVVDFASNQVRVVRDKEGAVVEGDPARIDLVRDRWTFSRKATSQDPNWILVATGGAA
jgi:predicted lipid-binding transport protein (Tim44 family)